MFYNLSIIFFLLLSTVSIAQLDFKPAYYIDVNETKVEGFINIKINNDKNFIDFKASLDGDVKRLSVNQVKSFYFINENVKYVSFEVPFDNASDLVQQIGYVRNPVLENKTLFLLEEIEGSMSLYSYKDENKKRYFITTATTPITQLIFKKYLLRDSSNKMGTNSYYKQQLANNFTCGLLDDSELTTINYTLNDIREIVMKNNVCSEDFDYKDYKIKSKGVFNFSIRPGIKFTGLSIEGDGRRDVDFDNITTFRIGAEAEYILNKDIYNWALVAEANYHQYQNETSFSADGVDSTVNVEYSAVELSFGPRYYFNVLPEVKLFAGVNYILSLFERGEIDYSNFSDIDVQSNQSVAFSAGTTLYDHFVIEGQVHSNLNISQADGQYRSGYSNVVFIVGYKF